MAKTHRTGQKYMVEVTRVVAHGTFDDKTLSQYKVRRKKRLERSSDKFR